MKFNRWTLGLTIAVAIVAINASPPASALERDVGQVAISEVQHVDPINTAILAQEGVAPYSIAGAILANQEDLQIGLATTIVTTAALKEYMVLANTANTPAREVLVHSSADLGNEVALDYTVTLQQEGGVASGAWIV